MSTKIKRFKQGGGTGDKSVPSSSENPRDIDYRLPNLGSGFGNGSVGGSRSMGPQLMPTTISQPRSTLGTLTGTAAPTGYGIKLTKRFKKGGLAVKPVWDKERPDDLGKPKDLSVKRKKSAKARAKAAGRPYPNLIDNMAAARKKGK